VRRIAHARIARSLKSGTLAVLIVTPVALYLELSDR
jgi:hypothetical protein